MGKYLKCFEQLSQFENYKNSDNFILPNVSWISSTKRAFFKAKPKSTKVGDVVYWNGKKIDTIRPERWRASLGTAIGVVVIPRGLAPDGKMRIVSLYLTNSEGQPSTSAYLHYGGYGTDTELYNYTYAANINSDNSLTSYSSSTGLLPSDIFTGDPAYDDQNAKYKEGASGGRSPSPYITNTTFNTVYNTPNLEHGKNALSDMNGLYNTEVMVNSGSDYIIPKACYNYNDGVSNLQWYLPSLGELGFLMVRLKTINDTIELLNGVKYNHLSTYSPQIRLCSSTEQGDDYGGNGYSMFGLFITNGEISGSFTKYASDSYQVHPFAIVD